MVGFRSCSNSRAIGSESEVFLSDIISHHVALSLALLPLHSLPNILHKPSYALTKLSTVTKCPTLLPPPTRLLLPWYAISSSYCSSARCRRETNVASHLTHRLQSFVVKRPPSFLLCRTRNSPASKCPTLPPPSYPRLQATSSQLLRPNCWLWLPPSQPRHSRKDRAPRHFLQLPLTTRTKPLNGLRSPSLPLICGRPRKLVIELWFVRFSARLTVPLLLTFMTM